MADDFDNQLRQYMGQPADANSAPAQQQPAAPASPTDNNAGAFGRELHAYLNAPAAGAATPQQGESHPIMDWFKRGIADPATLAKMPKNPAPVQNWGDNKDWGPWALNTLEQFGRTATPGPETRTVRPSDIANTVGDPVGTARTLFKGASLGFGPRIEAGVRALTGQDYSEQLDQIREANEAYAKKDPEMANAVQLAGSGMVPYAGARTIMGEAPGIARQIVGGGTIGGLTAGVNAAGETYGNPGDSNATIVEKQIENALMAMPVGAVVGGVGTPILYQLGKGAGQAARFLTPGGQARNADDVLANAANKGGINLADLEQHLPDSVSPRARKMTDPADIREAQRLVDGGMDQKAVAKQFGVSLPVLRDRLAAEAPVPMNIIELAHQEKPAGGANLAGLARAAARVPTSEAKAFAFNKLTDRQMQQQGRVRGMVQRFFGTDDYEAAELALNNKIKAENDTKYDLARADDAANIAKGNYLDISKPVNDAKLKWTNSRGPIGAAMREAIEPFEPQTVGAANPQNTPAAMNTLPQAQVPMGSPNLPAGAANIPAQPAQFPIRTLQQFMDAKDQLAAVMDKYAPAYDVNGALLKGSGKIYAELANFRNQLYASVRAQNPRWWDANVAAKDGFAAQRAARLGQSLAVGSETPRSVLQQLDKMTPNEQELVRLSYGDRLMNHIAFRPSETSDIVRRMRLPGMQPLYERLLRSPTEANKFMMGLQRETLTNSSFNMLRGSPTTPDAATMGDMAQSADLMRSILTMDPYGMMKGAWNRMTKGIGDKNAHDLVQRLLEDDPQRVREILRSAHARQRVMGRNDRNRAANAVTIPTALNNTLISHLLSNMHRKDERKRSP